MTVHLAVTEEDERRLRLYMNLEQAADELEMSVGGVRLAMDRGELAGMFRRIGRSVRFSRPAMQLAALGLDDPAALGRFCRELGVRDLPSLLRFLSGPTEPPMQP